MSAHTRAASHVLSYLPRWSHSPSSCNVPSAPVAVLLGRLALAYSWSCFCLAVPLWASNEIRIAMIVTRTTRNNKNNKKLRNRPGRCHFLFSGLHTGSCFFVRILFFAHVLTRQKRTRNRVPNPCRMDALDQGAWMAGPFWRPVPACPISDR